MKDTSLREPFDPVRALGVVAVPVFFLFGLYLVAHGTLTPGGGFQGGVAVAVAIVLIWLVANHSAYLAIADKRLVDVLEGIGVGAYAAIGIGGMVAGAAFLESFDERGKIGSLTSGGTIALLNWASGIEVAAAMLLLASEFFEEVLVERAARRRR